MLVLLRAVLDRLAFAAGLFAGSQVPRFIADLRRTVAGALGEVERQIGAFQALADRFAEGSLEGLIGLHRASREPLFREEAALIEATLARRDALAQAAEALGGPVPEALWWVLRHRNAAFVADTWAGFQPGLVASYEAIVAALAGGFLASLAFAGTWTATGALLSGPGSRRRGARSPDR